MGNKLEKYNQLLYELKDTCSLQTTSPSSAIATNQCGYLILTNFLREILKTPFQIQKNEYQISAQNLYKAPVIVQLSIGQLYQIQEQLQNINKSFKDIIFIMGIHSRYNEAQQAIEFH